MTSISPICKKCKTFILALKSPTYRDFMIEKSLKSKTSKSHTWAPLTLTAECGGTAYADFKVSFWIAVFFAALIVSEWVYIMLTATPLSVADTKSKDSAVYLSLSQLWHTCIKSNEVAKKITDIHPNERYQRRTEVSAWGCACKTRNSKSRYTVSLTYPLRQDETFTTERSNNFDTAETAPWNLEAEGLFLGYYACLLSGLRIRIRINFWSRIRIHITVNTSSSK
jgi:hypothetical protein